MARKKKYREDKQSDSMRKAKPKGYRFKGKGKNEYKKPTKKQIASGSKRIYKEERVERSDEKPYSKAGKRLKKGGGVGESEWAVTINSNDGKSHDWVGFAKDEDDALHKAEQEAGFESVESGINMLTDSKGKKIEYKKGGFFNEDKESDSKRKAKPSGLRFKGHGKNEFKRPTKDQIDNKNVYKENRPERSDKNQVTKLEDGGQMNPATDEQLIAESMVGGEIAHERLSEILGRSPKWSEVIGGRTVQKCFLRPHYKFV